MTNRGLPVIKLPYRISYYPVVYGIAWYCVVLHDEWYWYSMTCDLYWHDLAVRASDEAQNDTTPPWQLLSSWWQWRPRPTWSPGGHLVFSASGKWLSSPRYILLNRQMLKQKTFCRPSQENTALLPDFLQSLPQQSTPSSTSSCRPDSDETPATYCTGKYLFPTKKRVFYGQADRKGWPPPPLRSVFVKKI